MNNQRYIIIMAGGASSRMKKSLHSHKLDERTRNIAASNHKSLIPFGEKQLPLLYYQLQRIKKVNVQGVFIITPMENIGFHEFLNNSEIAKEFDSLKIELIKQHIPKRAKKPQGTADAILQALDQKIELKHNSFVVMNGDNLYSTKSLESLFSLPPSQNALIGYDRDGLHFTTDRIQKFAVLKVDPQFFLSEIIEKPSLEVIEKAKDINGKIRVSMNIFKLYGPRIYPFLEQCPIHPIRKEKELPIAIQSYVKRNKRSFLLLPLSEHVPDLTAAQDIEGLERLL